MTKTVSQQTLVALAARRPEHDIDSYGAMKYTPRGYGTGRLGGSGKALFDKLIARDTYVPTIYSYGTPIAFFDAAWNRWVKPDVSYSFTTAKHQSMLYRLNPVLIPSDCGLDDEYLHLVTGRTSYPYAGKYRS